MQIHIKDTRFNINQILQMAISGLQLELVVGNDHLALDLKKDNRLKLQILL